MVVHSVKKNFISDWRTNSLKRRALKNKNQHHGICIKISIPYKMYIN